jgi:DNA-binding transcriptional regulator YiaG
LKGNLIMQNTDNLTRDKSTLESNHEVDGDNCAIFPEANSFNVRAYRLEKGMTQQEFARAYSMNLRTLKRWESEKTLPRMSAPFQHVLMDWTQSLIDKMAAFTAARLSHSQKQDSTEQSMARDTR